MWYKLDLKAANLEQTHTQSKCRALIMVIAKGIASVVYVPKSTLAVCTINYINLFVTQTKSFKELSSIEC